MNPGEDTSSDLWAAVWRLSEAWAQTPHVQKFAGSLPRNQPLRNRGRKATGIPALVQHLDVHAGMMMKPLMYSSRIPVLLEAPGLPRFQMPSVDQEELRDWLRIAAKLEQAHRMTLGWLRASLTGYPILRAPHLAPNTHLTTREMTTRYIWPKEEFALGLNQQPVPPSVADLLGADTMESTRLDEAVRQVRQALVTSRAWNEFNDAHHALTDEAKDALRAAKRELREQLSAESLDRHVSNLAIPRAEYRSRITAEVVGSLTGSARIYSDAFSEVDRLLDLTMGDIFGELVLFGEPWSVPAFNIEAPTPGEPIVAFELRPFPSILTPGQILWLRNEVVADAVRIEQISMKMDQIEGTHDTLKARVLQNTRIAWPASTGQF